MTHAMHLDCSDSESEVLFLDLEKFESELLSADLSILQLSYFLVMMKAGSVSRPLKTTAEGEVTVTLAAAKEIGAHVDCETSRHHSIHAFSHAKFCLASSDVCKTQYCLMGR